MRDTAINIENKIFEMISKKSALQRIEMAFGLFRTGKELILSSIANKGYSESRKRGEIFKRMYGLDFKEKEMQEIAKHLHSVEL